MRVIRFSLCGYWTDDEYALIFDTNSLPICPRCGSILFGSPENIWAMALCRLGGSDFVGFVVKNKENCFRNLNGTLGAFQIYIGENNDT